MYEASIAKPDRFPPQDELPSGPDSEPVPESLIRAEQIVLLYRHAPTSLATNILVAVLAMLVLAVGQPPALCALWVIGMLGAGLVRLSAISAWRRGDAAARRAAGWERRMAAAVFCMGLCWGTGGAILFVTGDGGQVTFTALVLGGLVAGSAATLGPSRGAYLAYTLPIAALAVTGILWRGDGRSQVIAGLFLLFEIAMIASVTQVNRLFRGNIEQRLEKERLACSLTGAARRLHQVNDDLRHEIVERMAAEQKIADLAFFDPLTGLPNRRLLQDRMQRAMAGGARSGSGMAALFIDMDNFKSVNDTHGHDAGDRLLAAVGRCLRSCVRESDTVARGGGDEFVVLLENLDPHPVEAATQAKAIGEKILAALEGFMEGPRAQASIGITTFFGAQATAEQVLKQADIAMYQAKASGRNTLRFFDPAMQSSLTARADLESAMREGLQKGQFILHYQPQVDAGHRIVGAEALVRWVRPGHGQVSPGEFIPLAEETGLILPLGHWVLESACRQLVAWSTREETRDIALAVNVSARQFHQPDFVSRLLELLDRTGAEARKLKLELTESMLVDNVDEIITKMTILKARGLSFSLDDFGTGYSSLSYLKRLPLDQLKIDQSFVRDLLADHNSSAIVETIIALGRTMGMSVIAEGVETVEQRVLLSELGCSAFQGYLFSSPVGAEAFEALVAQRPEAGMVEPSGIEPLTFSLRTRRSPN